MSEVILPQHIAIIMDGNGRWAKKRFLPRVAGHRAGVKAVREIVSACVQKQIGVLTLFAFSSENWRRPAEEVSSLMTLFFSVLGREMHQLHEQQICLRIIGDRSRFDEKLQRQIASAETLTQHNTGLKLVIAVNYGGRLDMTLAMQSIAVDIEKGLLNSTDVQADLIASRLATAELPEPDLLIRTSGEQRISNFFLWQLAYTELYFTPVFWPDFNESELAQALAFYASRQRRFGGTAILTEMDKTFTSSTLQQGETV